MKNRLKYFPQSFWEELLKLPADTEEIRIRENRKLGFFCRGKEEYLNIPVTKNDIEAIINRATEGSLHQYEECIKNGFITTKEGDRIGLSGQVRLLKNITSLNFRISHRICGISKDVLEQIHRIPFPNTLIISPPGIGKTTFLKDIIRELSEEFRISVVDERFELFDTYSGRVDLSSGGEKLADAMMMLKTMSPDIICFDEITGADDIKAVEQITNRGVSVIATIHAFDEKRLKAEVRELFEEYIVISMIEGKREYRICKN